MVIKKEEKKKKEERSPQVTTADMAKVLRIVQDLAGKVDELAKRPPQVRVIEKTVQEIPGTADLSRVKESTQEDRPITPPSDAEIARRREKIPVPPSWRAMVDEILGMDFGIDVVYPQSGSGFLFKIIVPEEKSNMSKDHREFYRVDVRTKAVNYNEGIDGVRKFCELVKKNLEKKPQ